MSKYKYFFTTLYFFLVFFFIVFSVAFGGSAGGGIGGSPVGNSGFVKCQCDDPWSTNPHYKCDDGREGNCAADEMCTNLSTFKQGEAEIRPCIKKGWAAMKSQCLCSPDQTVPGEPKCQSSGALVPCGRDCDDPDTVNNECCACNICHIFLLIQRIISFLIQWVATPLLGVMLIFGGVIFIGAHGNPEWITWGRRIITSAIIGFVIVLSSWIIVNTVIVFTTGQATGGVGAIFNQRWDQIDCEPDSPSGVFLR